MGAAIDASCGWDGAYISFRCLADDLPSILDLTVDILLNPTFPQAEWERVRGQTLAALKAETRQCRVARIPELFCPHSTRMITRTDFLWRDTRRA